MLSKKRKAPGDDGESDDRHGDDGPAPESGPRTASAVHPSTDSTPTAPPPSTSATGKARDAGPHHAQQRRGERGAGPDASRNRSDAYYRNLYASEPNFKQLAKQDASFAAFLSDNGQLDFTDPAAVMQLTKTLLNLDFGLKIELPDDRLCPPVPNRHNYILWIKDLMDTTSYDAPGRKICGLDVGTGASCIYPLLGTAQRPWYFVATDIDVKSLSYAKRNVELNGLEDQIRVIDRKPTDPLLPFDVLGVDTIDFVMMNPPFYESDEEMLSSAKKKARPPHSACTGAPVEMVCDGGEVAHVGRMLTESLVLRERVRWYTSMFGKVSSLEAMIDKLREHGIDNYAVTEFVQGNKTKRWALGWSFGAMRPAQEVARGMTPLAWKKVLPPITRMVLVTLPITKGVGTLVDRIVEVMNSLELLSWVWDKQALRGIGRTRENVWSRAWRRKKMREKPTDAVAAKLTVPPSGHAGSEKCHLGFAVVVEVGTSGTEVSLQWREGHDQGIFESLGGFLQGKLKDI